MLWAGLATISVAHAAPDLPPLPRLCEPAVGKTIDGKVPPPIVLNRFAGDNRLMRLEGRADKDNQLVGAKRVAVSDDEVTRLCESGFPVAVLDVGDAPKLANRPKTVVPRSGDLPTEFSIFNTNNGGYGPWTTYGYFWVPKAMPSGHTFQVVDFTVTPTNFQNSGPNSHFAVSTLTLSNSDLDHDFDGKGVAFFGGTEATCGSAQKTVLQSWAIQNYTDGAIPPCGSYPGCSNPVFNGYAPAPWATQPATCGAWDAVTPKRFLVGANIWQQSVYWRCQPGGTCPEFVSPNVDSTSSYFRAGGAGVAFLHVLSAEVYWTLYFTNVSSYTAP